MASHHGRESGFCEEVFKICRPYVFIISDKEMVHDTQETTGWYRQQAHGLTNLRMPWDTRYVFTTRNDHCMSMTVNLTGEFVLQVNSDRQAQKSVALGTLPALLPSLRPR